MAVMTTGVDIDSYCNKCKLALAHVIIAMNGTKVAKVECKTCRGVHAYRRDPATPAASSTTSKRASSGTTKGTTKRGSKNNIGPSDYDKVLKGQDLSRAQRYKASAAFSEGDVLDHITFGFGMVTRLLADSKIEVIFPAGMKVLVHSRAVA